MDDLSPELAGLAAVADMVTDPVVLALVAVGVVGVLVAFRGGARAGSTVTRRSREVSRVGGTLLRALVGGVVIAGVQWVVIAHSSDPVVWAVVLGLPAVFAGAALARVFVVTTLAPPPGGKGGRS